MASQCAHIIVTRLKGRKRNGTDRRDVFTRCKNPRRSWLPECARHQAECGRHQPATVEFVRG